MSGPVDPRSAECHNESLPDVEVREGRTTEVGGIGIARILPTKGRRTVGAWCFVDLMTPHDVANPLPLEIGPHPHIGLQTVTWLFSGTALHSDSLGTEQLIRPGELNLMTSGHGIAHAELGMVDDPVGGLVGDFAGVQMWIALPEATRHGGSGFEHVAALPEADLRTGDARVLIGGLESVESPARTDTPIVGLEVRFDSAVEIPARPGFEYAVVPLDRPIKAFDAIAEPGSLALVPAGIDSLPLEVEDATARALVLGGEPLGESIQMWWNFVARSKEEIVDAWRSWNQHDTDRFGPVPSDLDRIEAPRPPWA